MTTTPRIGGFGRIALLLLIAHLVLGAARIPGVVVGRRCADVAEHERVGAARYLFEANRRRGADVVEWCLANVPADGVVLYRGDSKGAIEFVPALIAPRLLVHEGACAPDAVAHAGRTLARRDGRVAVIASLGDEVRLETR